MLPVRAQPPLLCSPALFLSLLLCPRHTLNPSLTKSRVPGRKRGSEKKVRRRLRQRIGLMQGRRCLAGSVFSGINSL